MKRNALLLGGMLILLVSVSSAEDKGNTEITIYNQDFGVVKEIRNINLREGVNTVMVQDIAKFIDPTSVSIRDLTALTQVLEQNYLYDLVSKEKIFEKYIGEEITVIDKNGETIRGSLLSFSGDELVIQNAEGVHILKTEQVSLPRLPEGLITKPTLKWLLDTEKGGTHQVELSYMTSGLNWTADYVAVVNNDETQLDLTCWVTITNNSGASYENVRLKLIAGEVHMVEAKEAEEEEWVLYMKAPEEGQPPLFMEEAFFEYHMYTLQRKTDILDNQQKQVTLFEANDVSAQKEYVFEVNPYSRRRYEENPKVKVMLILENTEKNNMGMPLPAGKVRVYKKDTEGQLQFIGEDLIDHTPKDEKVRIYLGDAFDIVGEAKRTNYNSMTERLSESSYQVSLRNHKNEDVTITVIHYLWGDWDITQSSHEWMKEDAYTALWYIDVPKNGEVSLTYTVRILW